MLNVRFLITYWIQMTPEELLNCPNNDNNIKNRAGEYQVKEQGIQGGKLLAERK